MARWIRVMFEQGGEHTPVAFTVHEAHIGERQVDGLPVVPFEGLADSHPPDRAALFAASGYRRTNALRAEVCEQARGAGYELPNLLCPGASVFGEIGDNIAIAPGGVVMPHAKLGSGSILSACATVGHDAVVGECCYLSAHSGVLGRGRVGDRCFLGAGALVRNGISVGERSVIGAGALIMKDAAPDSVYSMPGTKPREILSSELDDL
jgi:carbonic anhydrase/acetyltransferase-like protein (isoleucine patch superfamily)